MDSNCTDCLQDAMDKLWFQQSILLFKPGRLSVSAMISSTGFSSATPPNSQAELSLATSAENSSQLESPTKNNRQVGNGEKIPRKLSIMIEQPLFELQQPRRIKVRSHPSTPSVQTGTPKSKRRVPEMTRSSKSLSELENYELKGFMDLGFVFHKDKLSPRMLSMLPGLQRLGEKGEGEGEKKDVDEKRVARPYLSEAWLVHNSNSLVINLQRLRKSPEGADVKKHLRYWAQKVAALIQDES